MNLVKERKGIELKFFELCQKIVPENGLKLYDLEYLPAQQLLRVYIYNEETKTAVIEDCMTIDRALTPYTEEESWIPEALVLEVSSPGIYRNLSSEEHFLISTGEMAQVTLQSDLGEEIVKLSPKALKGKKFRARIEGIEGSDVSFSLEDIKFKVDIEKIKKVVLDPEL